MALPTRCCKNASTTASNIIHDTTQEKLTFVTSQQPIEQPLWLASAVSVLFSDEMARDEKRWRCDGEPGNGRESCGSRRRCCPPASPGCGCRRESPGHDAGDTSHDAETSGNARDPRSFSAAGKSSDETLAGLHRADGQPSAAPQSAPEITPERDPHAPSS